MNENPPITSIEEARRFMVDCFVAVGTCKENAHIAADYLLETDCRGHYSHGMNRLEKYLRDIQTNMCDANAVPTIEKETVASALVNGNNGLGAVIGKFCMNLAIKKALVVGIGIVTVHGSNHYGISQLYTKQAIDAGFIGLCFTNTSPLMVPTRAKDAALGTNPIALGAPAKNGDVFNLDMATTAVAMGKIELSARKGMPIPPGWALNCDGQSECDPKIAMEARRLMPLGGAEENSGYKGMGLGMLVEILCGILSGSAYGPHVRKWGDKPKLADLGSCFIAINPSCFAPGFEERLSDFMDYMRNMQPVDPNKPVMLPGDMERGNLEKARTMGGLIYVADQHETCAKLAKEFGIAPLSSLGSKVVTERVCSCGN